MTELFLSDPNDPNMPQITEHDHSLWYSSIWTPEVEIWSVTNGMVNLYWKIPQGWVDIIANRLVELKERWW